MTKDPDGATKIDANKLSDLKNLEPIVALLVKSLLEKDLESTIAAAPSGNEGNHDCGSTKPGN